MNEQRQKADQMILDSRNYELMVLYCEKMFRGRWPALETKLLVAQEWGQCMRYASRVLKSRWPELEERMLSLSTYRAMRYLYEYAKEVMRGQLPEVLHNRMIGLAMEDRNVWYIRTYFGSKKYQRRRQIACERQEATGNSVA